MAVTEDVWLMGWLKMPFVRTSHSWLALQPGPVGLRWAFLTAMATVPTSQLGRVGHPVPFTVFWFICDPFGVISLGRGGGVSTVGPVSSRMRKSFTITTKLSFHFHLRPHRNWTCAPLLSACIAQMFFFF